MLLYMDGNNSWGGKKNTFRHFSDCHTPECGLELSLDDDCISAWQDFNQIKVKD